MASWRTSEWVEASPRTVFAALTDFENGDKWSNDIVSAEKITPGPVGLGTRFREIRRINGRQATAVIAVSAFEQGRSYSAESRAMGMTCSYHYALTEECGGTRIDLEMEVSGNLLMLPMRRFMLSVLKRSDAGHLKTFKSAIESIPAQ